MASKKNGSPNLDATLEAFVYLYAESRRVTRAVAEQYGLTGSQLLVLKMLEPVSELSLSALSEGIRAKNSTVTGIIDRMERDGVVVRKRSDEDRRVVNLTLTAKGKKLAAAVKVDPMHLFRALLEDLPESDAAELERIMTHLARRVRDFIDESEAGGAKDLGSDPRLARLFATERGRTP
ncbi:MAG TPA: MarR family transcriptional regulator [Polyangiaceae bacterium]|nr:MarR family transcriptional regulator [Polyangiaceae bacterium]